MAAVLVYVSTTDGAADEVALQALALGSQLAAGGDVHAVVMGDAAAAATLSAHGRVDVLVNNAGVARIGAILDIAYVAGVFNGMVRLVAALAPLEGAVLA